MHVLTKLIIVDWCNACDAAVKCTLFNNVTKLQRLNFIRPLYEEQLKNLGEWVITGYDTELHKKIGVDHQPPPLLSP